MKTRFLSSIEKELYNIIYDGVHIAVNENKNFSDVVSNIVLKNRFRLVENKHNIAVSAILDSLKFDNKNLSKNNTLNESILSSGKNVNLYNCIYESVKLHKKTKKPINVYVDEGLIAGAIGALAGVSFGPAIGKALCDALGIGKGVLYDLMTSKLVNAAICGKLGLRF